MRRSLQWLLALLASAGVLPACAQRRAGASSSRSPMHPYQTETFPLSVGPATVEGYPATIQLGNFVRSDSKTFPVPLGHFSGQLQGRRQHRHQNQRAD